MKEISEMQIKKRKQENRKLGSVNEATGEGEESYNIF